MPEYSEVEDETPLFFQCDPLDRQFPTAWRDTRFRRSAEKSADGKLSYRCPICQTGFDHTEVDYLQGDHIWPYSLCGDTSWANYQLICGSCNSRKSNFIDDAVRKVLGESTFRKIVCDYLRKAAADGRLSQTEMVKLLLTRDDSVPKGN